MQVETRMVRETIASDMLFQGRLAGRALQQKRRETE